jgi:PTS system nitrogen regulatory IIA component
MEFQSAVCRECILLLNEKTKTEALIKLADTAATVAAVTDRERLIKEIFYREQLMSTGIGLGVAIPHVRFDEIQKPLLAVGVQPAGIPDYASIDDQPVKIIIMILMGAKQHKEYVRLLAQIVTFLKSKGVIERIIAAGSTDAVFEVFTENVHE